MATYLDVLVELLTDPEGRDAYGVDPAGWLRGAGLGFLCGEDILAARPVLTDWAPDLAAAFDQVDGIDPQPALGESELDAAVRVLDVLVEKVGAGAPGSARFG